MLILSFLAVLGLIALLCLFFACSNINSESNELQNSYEKEKCTDFKEESEGDGLVLFNDPLFPPEFEEEQ
jgi:hypothetical protein